MSKVDKRDETLLSVGDRIRQRRKVLDLTQEQLALKADVSKSFISEVESGAAAASGLVYLRLAEQLGVSVQYLLTGDAPAPGILKAEDVAILPLVARLGEEERWSYRDVLDVSAALQTLVARRSREGERWEPTRDYVLAIAKAVRGGNTK